MGLLLKGVNINITHKQSVDNVDKPKQYNESLVHTLPPEVQEYYKSTNGRNIY